MLRYQGQEKHVGRLKGEGTDGEMFLVSLDPLKYKSSRVLFVSAGQTDQLAALFKSSVSACHLFIMKSVRAPYYDLIKSEEHI